MKRSLTFLLILLLTPICLSAQTGKIKGNVSDLAGGEALIGANILIVGTSLGAATDANGDFTVTNIEAGVYSVRASYIGYQSKTISNIRINAGLTTELNFELAGEGFEVAEITVMASRPLVNKYATNANRISTSEDIEALPVRGINNILSLTAGVTFQDDAVFVRGGRLDEVGYYLEGASISDPVVGGRAITISQDAVEEIQIQSGGYTAEYGGANSGIIYTQIKSGTPDFKASLEYITDNITFQGRDSRYDGEKRLGTHWYGYSEAVLTLSGPILDNRIKFFGLANYNYQADKNPQPYPGINLGRIGDASTEDTVNFFYPAGALRQNYLNQVTGTGTLTFDFNPFIFRVVGTYTNAETTNPYTSRISSNVANMLNEVRTPIQEQTDGAFSGKLTFIIDPTSYVELSGGYSFNTNKRFDPVLKDNWMNYGDSTTNASAGYDVFRGEFEIPARIAIFNFSFHPFGDVMSDYLKFEREKLNFTLAFSKEIGKAHSIKIGGELQSYSIRNWGLSNERVVSLAGIITQNSRLADNDPAKQTVDDILITSGVNNYGYDLFGNEYNGENNFDTGELAPHEPIFISAYAQDKIEWRDLVVNIGFRWDYIDIDNKMFVDHTRPGLTVDPQNGRVFPEGLTDVPTFNAVSPRLGFSFAMTDQTVFHAQYGKFVQQTRLRDAYQGYYATATNLRPGFQINSPVGFNIRPTRTTQYEIGFTQQIGEFASFDITGYYKDIKDQIVYDQQQVAQDSDIGAYAVLQNGDFATTKGVEISFNTRRIERFQINANVAFQDARGTGSFPNSNRGIVGAPLDGVTIFRPQYVSPLDYNNDFSGSINLDYRFGQDDGPSILHNFGVSALMTFTSGHPYTTGKGGADLEGDARDRQPLEPLNSSRTPSTFQVDLRLDKTINVAELFDLNIYFHAINLFDTRNIENVFLRTGSTDDDGYLSDPATGGQLVETFGQQYADLYQAINIDYYQQWQLAMTNAAILTTPYFYGPPRQLRLGIKLEY